MKIVKLSKQMQTYGVRGRVMSFLTINDHVAFTAKEIAKYVKAPLSSVYGILPELRASETVSSQLIPGKKNKNWIVYNTSYVGKPGQTKLTKNQKQLALLKDKIIRELTECDVWHVLVGMRDRDELTPEVWKGILDRAFLVHNHIDDAGLKILFPENWKAYGHCRDKVKARKK